MEVRALYEGGAKLLRNDAILEHLFPRHLGEHQKVYEERKKRAYYVAHLSTIVDHVTAGLATDPVKVSAEPAATDPFYADLVADVSPPGGMVCPLNKLMHRQATTALLHQRAWTLVDLPSMPPNYSPQSEAEQVAAGALDAYFVAMPPECVLDWRADQDGRLYWLMTAKVECVRESPYDSRDRMVETYTAYTDENWVQWEVSYRKDATGDDGRPGENKLIAPKATGKHSFGAVPAVMLEVPPGLCAGDKLSSLAREHFNKRCALSWAEYKSLYSQLYEFLASEWDGGMTLNEHQADPNRATRGRRGPGYVQERGKDDRAEYVGPDTAAFSHALASSQQTADDMYRVLYQLALAQDTSGAMIRRSADSKKLDGTATMVVLTALGEHLRHHVEALFRLAAAGRKDPERLWKASGYENFDPVALQQSLEEAIGLEGISIPSPTFQRVYKRNLAKQVLGDTATPEEIAAIARELEQNITGDMYAMPALMSAAREKADDDADDDAEIEEVTP